MVIVDQFYKTKPCALNEVGKCTKGEACTFAHGVHELVQCVNLTKTAICQKWLQGKCGFTSNLCRFAHGEADLRSTSDYYKTDLCRIWKAGQVCQAGSKCRHAHGKHELRTRVYRKTQRDKSTPKPATAARKGKTPPLAQKPAPPKDPFLRLQKQISDEFNSPLGDFSFDDICSTRDEDTALCFQNTIFKSIPGKIFSDSLTKGNSQTTYSLGSNYLLDTFSYSAPYTEPNYCLGADFFKKANAAQKEQDKSEELLDALAATPFVKCDKAASVRGVDIDHVFNFNTPKSFGAPGLFRAKNCAAKDTDAVNFFENVEEDAICFTNDWMSNNKKLF